MRLSGTTDLIFPKCGASFSKPSSTNRIFASIRDGRAHQGKQEFSSVQDSSCPLAFLPASYRSPVSTLRKQTALPPI